MNRVIKSAVSTTMALALIFTGAGSIFAADEEVTLDQVRTWTEEDNIDLARLFDDWEEANIDVETAYENEGVIGTSDLAWWKSQSYDIMAAELAAQRASWSIVETGSELDQEAVNLYYEILFADEDLAIQALAIEAAEAAYEETEVKFEMGLETQLNLDSALVDLMAAEAAMVSLTYTYDNLMFELNLLANKELDAVHNLEDVDVPEIIMPSTPTETDINIAISTNKDLSFMEAELELTEELKMIYHDLNDNDAYDDEYAASLLSIDEQQLAIEDMKRSIEIEILTTYNSLLNSADDITISELTLESLRIDLAKAEEQFALGLVTESYVESIERNIMSQEVVLDRSRLTFYNDVTAYELLMEGY